MRTKKRKKYHPPIEEVAPPPIVDGAQQENGNHTTKKLVKRRLKRQISGYDGETKRWIGRNTFRFEVLDKVKAIFDEITDDPSGENKVSSVMANIGLYEEEWARFPKTAESTQLVSADKLTYNLELRYN